MDYLFVLDVSQEAVRSGFLQTACSVLLDSLYGHDDSIPPCFPQSNRIAILTFDRTLHFYNLSVRSCLRICVLSNGRMTPLLSVRSSRTPSHARRVRHR